MILIPNAIIQCARNTWRCLTSTCTLTKTQTRTTESNSGQIIFSVDQSLSPSLEKLVMVATSQSRTQWWGALNIIIIRLSNWMVFLSFTTCRMAELNFMTSSSISMKLQTRMPLIYLYHTTIQLQCQEISSLARLNPTCLDLSESLNFRVMIRILIQMYTHKIELFMCLRAITTKEKLSKILLKNLEDISWLTLNAISGFSHGTQMIKTFCSMEKVWSSMELMIILNKRDFSYTLETSPTSLTPLRTSIRI